jgi:hypothetical protein
MDQTNHSSCCGILGHALVSADASQVVAWRNNPATLLPRAWPPGMFKQSEDQTIVSLAALTQVIRDKQLSETDMAKWGVIAGPIFLGRAVLSAAFDQFDKEGAWGVSPHLIPHRFLHSVSGTLSLALGMHGPNFGVGGGASSHWQAAAMACTLAGNSLAGMWLMLCGYEPDRLPDAMAGANSVWRCHALVLALVSADHPQSEQTLLVTPNSAKSSSRHRTKPIQLMKDLAAALGSADAHLPAFSDPAAPFMISVTRNNSIALRTDSRAA